MRWSLARRALPLVTATVGLGACAGERTARLGPPRPLLYDEGADDAQDRPRHVRAASAVVALGDDLAVLQDDARFVARIHGNRVQVIALPADLDGLRLFDDGRGNKAAKLDLEASLVLQGPRGPRLVAFGSGSSPRRETLVMIDAATERVELREVPAFYRGLREHPILGGAQLNIEGSVVVGDTVRLFQRGNGKSPDGEPVNATLDLDRAAFTRWLEAGAETDGEAPRPVHAARHDLGRVAGVPYGFTDATVVGDHILFVAVAEASEDAVLDGAVLGVSIGTFQEGGVSLTPLLEADGTPSTRKVEGIAVDPREPGKLVVVTDVDDHERAAEMCSLFLDGFW